MTEFIQLTTTTGDKATAAAIASTVVERKLAACAQVGGPIRSVYPWQGQVQHDEEWTVVLKTHLSLFDQVVEVVREVHTYDCPQIVAVPLVAISPDYLKWLSEVLGIDASSS